MNPCSLTVLIHPPFITSDLMLSKKAKYAIKALTVLCKGMDQPSLGIAYIARQENIPRKFLESILREVRIHGFLISKRGKAVDTPCSGCRKPFLSAR